MSTPFPGMDPYLESPGIWQQIHADLIVDIRRFLAPRLRPRYYVAIEQLTYLTILPPSEERVGRPDVMVVSSQSQDAPSTEVAASAVAVAEPIIAELPQPEEVKHRYLEIRDTETQTVITTIEILSPANKVGREGRKQYEDKRLKILGSLTNLVEIDLLRTGAPMPMKVSSQNDYRIVISRSHQRPRAEIYLFNVRQPIPDFPIPLQPGEEEPMLPLNQILHDVYDKSSYDLMVDYQQPLAPPLSEKDTKWATSLLSPG
jgi:hypothetical protein